MSMWSKAARFGMLALALVAGGCASEGPKKETWTDQATRDPYGFNPKMDEVDISGGGVLDYNQKSMGRDVDHVFNP